METRAESLPVRVLSDEEKIILFGKSLVDIAAVKVLDANSFCDMLEAVYEGQEVVIDAFSSTPGYCRVYAFCDLPVGSRWYYEQDQYDNKLRSEVYGTPSSDFKCRLNEFFIPKFQKAFSEIDPLTNPEYASEAYAAMGAKYNKHLEAMLGSCFLNLNNGKVISISTFDELYDKTHSVATNMLKQISHATMTESDSKLIWGNAMYGIVVNKMHLEDELIPNDAYTSRTLDQTYKELYELASKLTPLHNWSRNADSSVSVVIANNYLKYNGYYLINGMPYMGMTRVSNSPLQEEHNNSGVSTRLCPTVENYMAADGKRNLTKSDLFRFTRVSSRYYGSCQIGSFIFVDKDALETSELHRRCSIPELLRIDGDFFPSVIKIFSDGIESGTYHADAEKFKKTEFAIKKETLLSSAEVENSRYDTIRSSDSKLFVLPKTSKARESAKKTAISRKITNAMQPVVDFVVGIFAADDFEVGHSQKHFKYKVSYKNIFGSSSYTSGQLTDESLRAAYDDVAAKEKPLYEKYNISICHEVIKEIYEKVNYQGSPFGAWSPKICQNPDNYGNNWNSMNEDRKKTHIFGLVYGAFHSVELSGLLSTSSNLLDIVALGKVLYGNSQHATFDPAFSLVKSTSSYHHRNLHITGRQMYHLYVNNFIGDNAVLLSAIENCKNSDYISMPTNSVSASTAFTFSQEALDSITLLRKCKTFADYKLWFDATKPTLATKMSNVFEVEDRYVHDTLKFISGYYSDLLDRLAAEEAQHLPKEEKKTRGRKKKVTAEDESAEAVTENVTEEATFTVVTAEVAEPTTTIEDALEAIEKPFFVYSFDESDNQQDDIPF